jgi:putative tryptophan/tyrosine transport system substrate-binding protein
MNRRKLLAALGACALAAPFASPAQPPGRIARVGFLMHSGRAAALDPGFAGAFSVGMRDLGYSEGKDLALEWRFADGKPQLLPGLAAELVRWKPDVLVAGGNEALVALQQATTTLPIVVANASDAAGVGLIKELAKSGGNVTGLATLTTELGPKRLEMLLGVVPRLSRVAVLLNPASPTNLRSLQKIQAAGKKIRVNILPAEARSPGDFDGAFTSMREQNAEALIVLYSPFFAERGRIAELAVQNKLPTITFDEPYAEAGCLISYGNSLAYTYHRAASFVDRILKGAKPADLPVEQSTKFAMVVNRKTANAIGVTIKPSVLISADRVIE